MAALAIRIFVSVLIVSLPAFASTAGRGRNPFSAVPSPQQSSLAASVAEYVKAYRTHDWEKLYDLVSDSARGGVARAGFVGKMRSAHGEQFSNFPDLMEFEADRTIARNEHEYDIFGCGAARREKMDFRGIAVVHAVFEHNAWHFSGWSFTEFPNEPCNLLKKPSWEPPDPMEWGGPMGELKE
ncbi:MAG TPA: hypothetical protein VFR84_07790 [Candidatus Angelobacter sp.]|nr:hypothetical protein [Candidatus Angelobacter sp.]